MRSSSPLVRPTDPARRQVPAGPARLRDVEERDWYTSSHDLARGLEVSEDVDDWPADLFPAP